MIVARLTPAAISVSSSSHLPPIDASIWMKPVRFPPGRGRLATKPTPTGSETTANLTISGFGLLGGFLPVLSYAVLALVAGIGSTIVAEARDFRAADI